MVTKFIAHVSVCLLLLILALSSTTSAQTASEKLRQSFLKPELREQAALKRSVAVAVQREHKGMLKPFGWAQNLASAGCFGSTGADVLTQKHAESRGFTEGNPRLRGSDGRLQTGKALAIKFGLCSIPWAFEKKYPKWAFTYKVAAIALNTGAAIYNSR